MEQGQKVFLAGRRIGIDKLVLRLEVKRIDFVKLKSSPAEISFYDPAGKSMLYDESGMPVRRIVIKDNQVFSDLCIGCQNTGEYMREYAYLTLTVSQARGGNVQNMSWTEYDHYLSCVTAYIADAYGVRLDAARAKIKSIEINCNVGLAHPYAEYRRVMAVLFGFLPKTLKTAAAFGRVGKAEKNPATYMRKNKQVELIVYDKREQTRQKKQGEPAQEETGLLRIELRLLTPEKTRQAFGTDLWRDLDDITIVDYYYNTLQRWWTKGVDTWCAHCVTDLKKRFRAARRESVKNWHHILIHGLKNDEIRTQTPVVLDIE